MQLVRTTPCCRCHTAPPPAPSPAASSIGGGLLGSRRSEARTLCVYSPSSSPSSSPSASSDDEDGRSAGDTDGESSGESGGEPTAAGAPSPSERNGSGDCSPKAGPRRLCSASFSADAGAVGSVGSVGSAGGGDARGESGGAPKGASCGARGAALRLASCGGMRIEQKKPVLVVESGEFSSSEQAEAGQQRPPQASKLPRLRSGVRRRGPSPRRHQAGRWGGVVKQGRRHFQPAAPSSRPCARRCARPSAAHRPPCASTPS